MSPAAAGWDEAHLAEEPAVELLRALGYVYVAPDVIEGERQSLRETVLTTRLATALHRINPWLNDTNVTKAVRAVTSLPAASLAEANEKLYVTLTYGTALEQDRGEGKKAHTVRFFDFERPAENEWLVTRQFRVLGSKKHVIADLAVFVNGIPLGIIECKSPTIGDKWKADAINQLRRYQEADSTWKDQGAPKLFEPVQLVVATCRERAVYGTVGTPGRYFLEWKVPYPLTVEQLASRIGRAPTAQDILLYGLFEPGNLLDLVRNFVVFEVEHGRAIRKMCRYKQFIAVNEAMRRIRTAKQPAERGGVVWHTQGSGKSLSMLWLATKLRRDAAQEHPTIVIVTDRTKLDKQISDVFQNCGFPNPERAEGVRDLRQILTNPTGRTVLTTIQKFQELTSGSTEKGRSEREAHPTLSDAANIFVMVDEAHRTQYRSLAANMRAALPNACFLGFTGTPIDKKDRSTLHTFGPYIDTYTIEQAVQDGATVPIFYESRLPNLQILGQTIDQVFDHVFADRTDEERAAIKKRYATEAAIAAAPRRIDAICLDLIAHYRAYIQPNGFKAQVVTVNREVAAIYKETLDRLNAPESAVIMSSQHNDPERLARWSLSRDQQDRLIERFKDRRDPLSLLVVCDMLLTGFDAPVEQVMYLDSPLREHTLLQAIARVNRTADKKDYGLVVDYWGISSDLHKALAIFSPRDIQGALESKVDELPRLQSRHAAVMRLFQKVRDRNNLDECVAVLEPEDARANFDQEFRRFSQSMDMLLPDPRALVYTKDLRWLGKIRGAARARFHDDRLDVSACGEKVRKIIDDAVIADGIQVLVKEVPLLSKEFEDKVKALGSDDAKASEMEHAIRHEIHVRLEENPAFYQSLRERLEAIIEARREARIQSAQELLDQLNELRAQIGAEQQTAQEMGLTPTGFAIYGLLEDHRPPQVAEAGATYNEANRDLASLIDEAVVPDTRLVDWWQKDDVQREMRRKIKRQLRASGLSAEEVERLAAEIVDLAKVRADR
jgi:type I restriction enzyme R subunit